MISKTVEYGLRAAVWLAAQPRTARTTQEIAAATHVPAGYLAKVLQTLAESGLIVSQRGLGGGFLLARAPSAISVLDIVNAVEPIVRITVCPLELEQHRQGLCALHRKLDEAYAAVESAFSNCSLNDLVAHSDPALCPSNSKAETNSVALRTATSKGKPARSKKK